MQADAGNAGIMEKMKNFAASNQIGMALLLSLLLFGVNVAMNPNSLNQNAFGAIFSLTAMLTLASAGQTLVVTTGGIDMSVGAVMSMTALITVGIMRGEDGFIFITFVLAVLIGFAIGLLNGLGVAKIGLPPMIVTMCIANVVTRLQYVFTQGKPTGTASAFFSKTMTYRILNVFPTSIFYTLVIFGLVFFLMNRSKYGQQLFLTGNNERAAYLNGIKTKRIITLNYAFAGMFAGIAGFLGAGYMNFVNCGAFESYTMKTIVAVVIGGTLLTGGKGSYTGTVAGALLITVLTNCLSVLNLSQSTTDLVMGVVLIVLLAAYNRAKPIRQ